MIEINKEYLEIIGHSNRLAYYNYLIIISFCLFLSGCILLYENSNNMAILLFFSSFVYLYFSHCVNEKVTDKRIKSYYYIMLFLIICLFYVYAIFLYLTGYSLSNYKRYFYVATAIPCILIQSRSSVNKLNDNLIYVFNIILLICFLYFLYGSHEFWSVFDNVDSIYVIFIILMTLIGSYTKIQISEKINNTLWEKEFNIERFNNLFRNLMLPIISINKLTKKIENNNVLVDFLKKISSEDDYTGFFNIDEEELKYFYTVTKQSNEYKNFHNLILKNIDKTTNNTHESIESSQYSKNDDIFNKKLFYLNKIINDLQNKRSSTTINSTKTSCELFSEIMNRNSTLYNSNERFKNIGSFYKEGKQPENLLTFDMFLRRCIVFNSEIINLKFYDTSNITQMEKEKIQFENKRIMENLSLIADKFMTPIQVLIHTINLMTNECSEKNMILPTSIEDITNLGTYIYTLSQDISSYSKVENGYDVNFDIISVEDLFRFGQQTLNLLIKNNSTKCYAIKTELIIAPNVPKYVKSDINRLRQVLINLLTNAYKFTLAGFIKITVSLEEVNDEFDEIMVQIEDTGIGLDPQFTYAINNQETNTRSIPSIKTINSNLLIKKGFGLLISQNIIDRIGRSFGCKIKSNGSTFYFSFLNFKSKALERSLMNDNSKKITDVLDERFYVKVVTRKSLSIDHMEDLSIKNNEIILNYEDKLNNIGNVVTSIGIIGTSKLNDNMVIEGAKDSKDKVSLPDDKNSSPELTQTKFTNLQSKKCRKIFKKYNKSSAKMKKTRLGEKFNVDDIENHDFYDFPDDVFNFYKCNSDDSIINSQKVRSNSYINNINNINNIDNMNNIHNIHNISNINNINNIADEKNSVSKHSRFFNQNTQIQECSNKITLFFLELYELSINYSNDIRFLKIYENNKLLLKFYYKSVKDTINTKQQAKKRILVVDDNKLVLKSLKNLTNRILKEMEVCDRFEVVSGYDGVDALAIFKLDHYISQSISLIISDHNMSMMDGLDLIKLVEKYKEMRDIKLCLYSTDNEELKKLNLKNISFLCKPARKSELRLLLNQIV